MDGDKEHTTENCSTSDPCPFWKTKETYQTMLLPHNMTASQEYGKEGNELKLGAIQIFVINLTGKTLSLEINSTDLILNLKYKLEEREGVPISQQRLVMGRKHLKDALSISDYNIQKGCTVHLLLCLKGGASHLPHQPMNTNKNSKHTEKKVIEHDINTWGYQHKGRVSTQNKVISKHYRPQRQ